MILLQFENVIIIKDDLKDQVKRLATQHTWFPLMKSSKVVMRWDPEKNSNRQYFSFEKLESRLMLALRIGELDFLTNRRRENISKWGSTHCFVQVCGGEDSLEHVSQCFGYESTFNKKDSSEQAQAEYLVALNRERLKKYRRPLIYHRKS